MLRKLITAFALSLLVTTPVMAKSPMPATAGCGSVHDCNKCHSMTAKEAESLLSFVGNDIKVNSVKPAPSHGLYELLVEQGDKKLVVYIDFGKKNLLQGQIVDLKTKQLVLAHEKELSQNKEVKKVNVASIPTQYSFVMGNPKGSKKLYVFDDPDCPYCRKLHLELKRLEKMAPDVAIHVMLMPLPMHPEAYDKVRTILETRKREHFDNAFEGRKVPKPTKAESKVAIERISSFAAANGISGTPTLVLPDGSIMVGARDAMELKKILDAMQ